MALDANDLVESFLDDQARVNAAVDNGDINNLVADTATASDTIGFQAETVTNTDYAAPHHWGDGHSFWGFVTWGN